MSSQAARGYVKELAIQVFRLPANAHPYRSDEGVFLALLREESRPWSTLLPDIAWLPATWLISEVCKRRAVLTVDGRLRVGRLRVKPEGYIRRWRRALDEAVDIASAARCQGARPTAVFQFCAEALEGGSIQNWRDPEFASLLALIEAAQACGDAVLTPHRCDDGTTVAAYLLTIDLTRPQGPRYAWWAQEFLRSCDGWEDRLTRVSIEMPTAQTVGHWTTASLNPMAFTANAATN